MPTKFKKTEGWRFWSSLLPTVTECNSMKNINVEVFVNENCYTYIFLPRLLSAQAVRGAGLALFLLLCAGVV
jgi:hypothetical protein